jgi:DNA-binding MarR family transcriptional regulator
MVVVKYDLRMGDDKQSDPPTTRSPEGPPGGSAVFLLSSLGFVASGGFADSLAPLGLEPRHYGVLNLVALSEGVSQRALTDPLGIPASRLVAIVDDLEQQGLVERRRNPDDRRAHALYLTPKGHKTLDRARRAARENEQRFTAALTPTEREQLLELLRRLATHQELPLGIHPGLARADSDSQSAAPPTRRRAPRGDRSRSAR